MAQDLNNVVLIGRLTKDVELRETQSGKSVVKFVLAVNDYNDDETNFIRCVAWNKTAELIDKWVRKGHRIAVTGRIKTGSYDNQNGDTVYTTDVIVNSIQFLQQKKQEDDDEEYRPKSKKQDDSFDFETDNSFDISDDDLPF